MTWNYRLVRHVDELPWHDDDVSIEYLGIHEAYYDDDGNVEFITLDPIVIADTPEEMHAVLEKMKAAIGKPELDYKDIGKIKDE